MHLRPGSSPVDGQVHRDNLDMLIATSRCTSMDSWRQIAPGFLDDDDVFSFGGGTGYVPKYVYVWDAAKQNLLLCICGLSTPLQATAILNGWSGRATLEAPRAYPYSDVASTLQTFIGRATSGTWTSVRVVGHSYGGAIAAHLISVFQAQTLAGGSYVYTYGSPKPDYRSQRNNMLSPYYTRVFAAGDPVPNLPLRVDQLPGYWRLLRNDQAQAWNEFDQSWAGYSVADNGAMSQSDNPTILSTIDYFSTLATWLTGATAFGAVNHSLDSYRALASLTPVVQQFDPSWRSGRTHTSPVTMSAVQMNERRVQDLIIEGNNAVGAPLVAAQGILNNVRPVPGERYHGTRRNGHWCIIYLGEVISFTGTRRNTRATVRYLNRSLRGP